jgi:hypothetical protein
MDVNHIVWGDTVFITEQIFNAGDGSFSRFHVIDIVAAYPNHYLTLAAKYASSGGYVLPIYTFGRQESRDTVQRDMSAAIAIMVEDGFYTPGAMDFPKIKALMDKGLQTGIFPDELEKTPFFWGTFSY